MPSPALSSDLVLAGLADEATRSRVVLDLQRQVGNTAVQRLITESGPQAPHSVGAGLGLGLGPRSGVGAGGGLGGGGTIGTGARSAVIDAGPRRPATHHAPVSVARIATPSARPAASPGSRSGGAPAALPEAGEGDQAHEAEAERAAADVVPRLGDPTPPDPGSGRPKVATRLSAAPAGRLQATPAVTNVVTSAAELGVGGRDITATATIAGPKAPLAWTINGGAPPTGVSIIGTGRTVRIHAAQPPAGTVVGGVPLTIRAALTATPGDFFDAPPVNLIQVTGATYAANPALAAVPSLIPGNPPLNTAEPNRDGIAGNSATVNAVTAPVGRPITLAFRRALGATIAGTVVTPGSQTGDIGLRITDTATGARLDETLPDPIGPAPRMADLTVNAVPTKVGSLTGGAATGPYGVINAINFSSSDNAHPPLARIVGELITLIRDDFNLPAPNAGFNNAFLANLAVPANSWNDQLISPPGMLNVTDGLPAIDVNRFVGPGVPHLPRQWTFRQRMVYASWAGAGATVSNAIADGKHVRSLVGAPGNFRFKTEHIFGAAKAPAHFDAYAGNPLIILSGVRATPAAAGATALAADGVATANLSVNSTVPGRTVNWAVRTGDSTITGGNPAALPATATLTAGVKAGTFGLRAADSVFPNRRADGSVKVAAVKLRGITATPGTVPVGTNSAVVRITADPGARTLNWTVDAAAKAAGVSVTPTTGPGLAMNVTVTRPAGFKGKVTVTAADSVLAARTSRVTIRFK